MLDNRRIEIQSYNFDNKGNLLKLEEESVIDADGI